MGCPCLGVWSFPCLSATGVLDAVGQGAPSGGVQVLLHLMMLGVRATGDEVSSWDMSGFSSATCVRVTTVTLGVSLRG